MKKIAALLLALVMLTSLTVTALAAGEKTGTTTLTATVPGADYTIHVPANMTLEYGNTSEQEIGEAYVTDVTGVTGAVECKVNASALKNGSNYIAVTYHFLGQSEVTKTVTGESEYLFDMHVYEALSTTQYVSIVCKAKVDDWTAEPGTYTATMTFNFSY